MMLMRRTHFFTLLFVNAIASVLILGAVLTRRDAVARALWTWDHNRATAFIALVLAKNGPYIPMEIGHFYQFTDAYDLDKAERAYRKALHIDPNIFAVHYELASIYFTRGRLYQALKDINEEFERHPENFRAHYIRGLIYGYMGDYIRAEADFMAFIVHAPDAWAGYNDLAWIQAKLGKLRDVVETIENAFARLPEERARNPWLWTSQGVALLNLGDYTKAKDAFLNTLSISEGMTAEYFWKAYPGNDPRNADRAFQQFRSTIFLNLGVAYERLGELDEARYSYKQFLLLAPQERFYSQRESAMQKIGELEKKLKE